mgnify:CR=1 FL=1|jgi:hypothetical protein
MAKVEFPFRVKYGGHFYAPHACFEAKDSDVDKLTALGAKVPVQKQEAHESVSSPKPPGKPAGRPTKSSKPYKIPSPTKKG